MNDILHTNEIYGPHLPDEGPHKTVWMVYDRTFPDGQRELTATKATRFLQNGPMPLQNRSRRGESDKREQNQEASARRAKQAVRQRVKAIGGDRMLTLTYRGVMADMDRLKRDFDGFRRRMGKAKQFQYVATVEKHKSGGFHMHVIVRGRQSYQLVRSIWQSVVGKSADGKSGGNVNVRDPHRFGFGKDGLHRLAAYISKYISKNLDDHELNKKQYWSSKGINIPEQNYFQLPYGTNEAQAYAYLLDLACQHNNNHLQMFQNSGLGVLWLATGPIKN